MQLQVGHLSNVDHYFPEVLFHEVLPNLLLLELGHYLQTVKNFSWPKAFQWVCILNCMTMRYKRYREVWNHGRDEGCRTPKISRSPSSKQANITVIRFAFCKCVYVWMGVAKCVSFHKYELPWLFHSNFWNLVNCQYSRVFNILKALLFNIIFHCSYSSRSLALYYIG